MPRVPGPGLSIAYPAYPPPPAGPRRGAAAAVHRGPQPQRLRVRHRLLRGIPPTPQAPPPDGSVPPPIPSPGVSGGTRADRSLPQRVATLVGIATEPGPPIGPTLLSSDPGPSDRNPPSPCPWHLDPTSVFLGGAFRTAPVPSDHHPGPVVTTRNESGPFRGGHHCHSLFLKNRYYFNLALLRTPQAPPTTRWTAGREVPCGEEETEGDGGPGGDAV